VLLGAGSLAYRRKITRNRPLSDINTRSQAKFAAILHNASRPSILASRSRRREEGSSRWPMLRSARDRK
jgi:hypothetical protein